MKLIKNSIPELMNIIKIHGNNMKSIIDGIRSINFLFHPDIHNRLEKKQRKTDKYNR